MPAPLNVELGTAEDDRAHEERDDSEHGTGQCEEGEFTPLQMAETRREQKTCETAAEEEPPPLESTMELRRNDPRWGNYSTWAKLQ